MSRPPQLPDRALTLIDRAVGWLARIGSITMVALVVLTGIGVFFRYVVNDPINGLGDILGLTLSITVACSLAYGGRVGAHVAVDVLGMVGGRKVTRWTDPVVRLLGIFIIGVAVYALIKNGLCGILCGFLTSSLAIPHEPFYYFLAFGLTAYGFVLTAEFIAGLVHFSADVDPSEKSN
ncbi:MAG: TRAP transporter small permease subunit [Alphaproteobacteria bacterium]|nr:TRAP transporter small permease subunit [Alphaproteobacteria bacterium]